MEAVAKNFWLCIGYAQQNGERETGERRNLPVLVFIGIELIFFIVANMRLYFGFVLRKVFIIQGYISYC